MNDLLWLGCGVLLAVVADFLLRLWRQSDDRQRRVIAMQVLKKHGLTCRLFQRPAVDGLWTRLECRGRLIARQGSDALLWPKMMWIWDNLGYLEKCARGAGVCLARQALESTILSGLARAWVSNKVHLLRIGLLTRIYHPRYGDGTTIFISRGCP